jgi:hypothetical protein
MSTDEYYDVSMEHYRETYKTHLYPHLRPSQKVMLVPYCTHALYSPYSCTVLMHCTRHTHALYSCTVLIHCTHALYSCTVLTILMYCTHHAHHAHHAHHTHYSHYSHHTHYSDYLTILTTLALLNRSYSSLSLPTVSSAVRSTAPSAVRVHHRRMHIYLL